MFPRIPDLNFLTTSVIIAPFETSEPVPDVVGIAITGKLLTLSCKVLPIISSTFLKFTLTPIALAASIALPPPRPIIKSTLFFYYFNSFIYLIRFSVCEMLL